MNVEPWGETAIGHTGDLVRGLQYLLCAQGRTVAVDGSFGPATRAAVVDFQNGSGLTPDGRVGPVTWRQVVIPTQLGDSGDAVRAVQVFPLFPFAPLVVDGSYGPATRDLTSSYQGHWGLTIDGACGYETWSFRTADDPLPLVKPGATDSTNWRVTMLQWLLRAHGATIAADGLYGPLTGVAVRQFQLARRALYVSTTVGQLDWPELFITVRLGDSGDAVRAAQTGLDAHLGALAVDGDFGPLTEAAVREFQRMWGDLVADGIFGPRTWRVMVLPKAD